MGKRRPEEVLNGSDHFPALGAEANWRPGIAVFCCVPCVLFAIEAQLQCFSLCLLYFWANSNQASSNGVIVNKMSAVVRR